MCGSRRVILALLGFALASSAGTYVVEPGDTLSGIAARAGVSVRALTDANRIIDPNRVIAGQSLSIPGDVAAAAAPASRTHVVASGDNLSRIAARYSTTVAAIVDANDVPDADHLRVGQQLSIPTPVATGLPARLLASPARMALIPHFQRWSIANNIDPALVMAIAWHESGWQNSVVSSAGAIGIGQLLPATARFVSTELIGVALDPTVPEHNIRMTARYVRFLLQKTGGNVDLALAFYFQGAGSVTRQGLLAVTEVYIQVVENLRPRFADI